MSKYVLDGPIKTFKKRLSTKKCLEWKDLKLDFLEGFFRLDITKFASMTNSCILLKQFFPKHKNINLKFFQILF